MSIALVNSYSIIYPEFFSEKYGNVICAELNTSMSDMRAEGIAMVLRCVETFLRTSPVSGPSAIKPIVGKIFQYVFSILSYLFNNLIIIFLK